MSPLSLDPVRNCREVWRCAACNIGSKIKGIEGSGQGSLGHQRSEAVQGIGVGSPASFGGLQEGGHT